LLDCLNIRKLSQSKPQLSLHNHVGLHSVNDECRIILKKRKQTMSNSNNLVCIKSANTDSGRVEIQLASGKSNYQIHNNPVLTTFFCETDGVWQLLANNDLAFIKTANTPNGHVEVHISPASSNYQERTVQTPTTFFCETDGVWQLLANNDLAFIKTANTPSGYVEVHISSASSNYQERIVQTPTTFLNETDGVWQLLANNDLAFIKTDNTPSGYVEVHISPASSNYQERTVQTPTVLLPHAECHGTWALGLFEFYSQNQMLVVNTGCLKAQYVDSYNLLNNDFTLSIMTQPRSAGTILSTGSFDLSISSLGALSFTIYRSDSSKSTSIVSGATSLINSTQCHIIACFAPLASQPLIYLDGNLLTTTTQSINNLPLFNQDFFIGNNADQTNQYIGGLMNVSLWGRILSIRESTLAGYCQIDQIGLGPISYWCLNGSLIDISVHQNLLVPISMKVQFTPCFNCINLSGPNSYGFVQIEGVEQSTPVSIIHYTQSIQVGVETIALLGTVVDNSGYARFPEGVFVKVTDPVGNIYDHDTLLSDPHQFVKTQPVDGHSTGSLFGLLVNNPSLGSWSVEITAPSNIYFLFQFQAYCAQDIIPTLLTTFKGVGNRNLRGFQTQVSAKEAVGIGLTIFGTIAVIATLAGAAPIAVGALGVLAASTGSIIQASDNLPISSQDVTFTPKINANLSLYQLIVNDLTSKKGSLKGKIWDNSMGTLPDNWLLQSGTVNEETNTKSVYHDLIHNAQNSIDILMFGSVSGDFKDELKRFINSSTEQITIRIFSGVSPNIDVSLTSPVHAAKKLYKLVIPGRVFIECAYAFYHDLLDDVNNIPSNIKLFVGAGDIPSTIVHDIKVMRGWDHHKIVVVDGSKSIIGGINFNQDSSNAAQHPNKAVNDVSALVEAGVVGRIQKFTNHFWNSLIESPLSSDKDYTILKDHTNIHGAYYSPIDESKKAHGFAILSSFSYTRVQSAIATLNADAFANITTPTSGDSEIITVGRRSGYKLSDNEPSDIAIGKLIENAKSSIFISQQAMCYPTNTTTFSWEYIMELIGQALERGVRVNIIVSRNPREEGPIGSDGGYSSDYASVVRTKILTYVNNIQNIELTVKNYPSRNHSKVVIVDNDAFYIGSQNLYPPKIPLASTYIGLGTLVAYVHAGHIARFSGVFILQCLKALVPGYLGTSYEVGLGECGIIVCDSSKTTELINNYWIPKWSKVK